MKISKRLKTIASMVEDNSDIIDVGCDHGLLSIYLVKEKNVKAIASDVNENALSGAINNIKKYHLENDIQVILTDGVSGLDIKNKTIIICGMGTKTICSIMDNIDHYSMKDLIIQSNHEIENLRKYMISKGFIIIDEKFIIEREKPYVLIKFKIGDKKYKKIDYIVGPVLKKEQPEYLDFIIKKKNKLLTSIPKRYFIYRMKIKREIYFIKKETSK